MRPIRALVYAIGVCVAFSLPSMVLALLRGFEPVPIALVLAAFGLLTWIGLMRPIFGRPGVARRATQVLRVVIIARLVGAAAPFGCIDMLTGGFLVGVFNNTDFYNGYVLSDFVGTALITVVQGLIVLIEFGLMSAAAYWVVRRSRLQHNPDICLMCGYDIRASRKIGRCPECGTPCPSPASEPPAPATIADEHGGF